VRPVPLPGSLLLDRVINQAHTSPASSAAAQRAYFEHPVGLPGVVVLDDFLELAVLEELRHYLLESTVWDETKQRYLGTYWSGSFHHPIILRLAEELRDAFPFVAQNGMLVQAWCFSYHNFDQMDKEDTEECQSGHRAGISLHADSAQATASSPTTSRQPVHQEFISECV